MISSCQALLGRKRGPDQFTSTRTFRRVVPGFLNPEITRLWRPQANSSRSTVFRCTFSLYAYFSSAFTRSDSMNSAWRAPAGDQKLIPTPVRQVQDTCRGECSSFWGRLLVTNLLQPKKGTTLVPPGKLMSPKSQQSQRQQAVLGAGRPSENCPTTACTASTLRPC